MDETKIDGSGTIGRLWCLYAGPSELFVAVESIKSNGRKRIYGRGAMTATRHPPAENPQKQPTGSHGAGDAMLSSVELAGGSSVCWCFPCAYPQASVNLA